MSANLLICTLGLFFSRALCHIQMIYPPPRQSQYNKFATYIDYNIMAPVTQFPCNGVQPGHTVAEFSAGSTVQVILSGTATHGGGHCQFSISYNNKDFVAIDTIFEDCLTGTGLTIDVKLPDILPSCDSCTFAWSWVNAIGNREFYNDCADISIKGSGNVLIGPRITVADLPGYPTIPEFPSDPTGDHGKKYYSNAPTITISPPGTPFNSPTTSWLKFASSSRIISSSTDTKATASITKTSPTTNPGAAIVCKTDSSDCESLNGFKLCSNNAWYSFKCPRGTYCKVINGKALCDTVPPPNSSSGGCDNNSSQCNGSSGFKLCSNGAWYSFPCSRGTICSMVNGKASCGWIS